MNSLFLRIKLEINEKQSTMCHFQLSDQTIFKLPVLIIKIHKLKS